MRYSFYRLQVTKNNVFASRVVFEGKGTDEKIYGLGEHRTGKVNVSHFIPVLFKNIEIYVRMSGLITIVIIISDAWL